MESWTAIALVVIGFFELILTIAIFYVGTKAGKIDKLEDSVASKAEKIIDSRFALAAAEFKSMVSAMQSVVNEIQKRLERGDENFDEQEAAQHHLELKASEKINDVRTWAMQTFGTKAELAACNEKLQMLEVALAKFEAAHKR